MALDYSMILNRPSVGQQLMQGMQLAQQQEALQFQQQQAEQAAQQEAAQAARLAEFRTAFAEAGSTQERAALGAQFPEMLETIKSAVGMDQELKTQAIGEIGMQLTALANDPAAAEEYVRQNADVLSSLGPAFSPDRLIQQVQTNPQSLAQTADMITMAALGPEKYQDIMGQREQRAVQRRGQDITIRGQDITRRGQDVQIMGQQAARENAIMQAQSRIEAARLRQEGSGYPDLSVNMEKALDTAIQDATASEAAASRLETLAGEFQQSNLMGGRAGQMAEWLKQTTGDEDALSELRRNFIQLKNERVINNLPPGVASDRDIEIFMSGFPQDFANKDYVASFMRGMAKAERAKAELNNFRAEWISQNGNPGQNRKPFEYNGMPIEEGVSLKRAFDQYIQQNTPWEQSGAPAAPAASGIQFLGFE